MSFNSAVKIFNVDKLRVEIYSNRKILGQKSAEAVSEKLKELLLHQENVRVIFAAAPSQNELLIELISLAGIDWTRVIAFHMDEYIGLENNSKKTFGYFLTDKLFSKVKFKEVHFINSIPNDLESECKRYSLLIKEAPIDIVCLGIGENGHIAFNDPKYAEFNDSKLVKVVKLDNISRKQQVNDGCFKILSEVPKSAITLTVPALISGKYLFTVVPGLSKADAVFNALKGEIANNCPASILRTHENSVLFLDSNSALKILNEATR
jgi:glucosamine-6-phosphate deaminase